ncbi:MAG TPA: T9SS type A sorting domain-containing protein, partial [Chitinophagaceae bacterium]
YTGTVSGLTSNNRTIIVAGGATFQPTLLDGTSNGIVCKMHIYGTFTYSSSLTTNTTFTLTNYAGGVVNLAALNTKGKDQVWTNNIGGTINFSGNVLLNGGTTSDDNNVFTNYETINANGNFQMNSGSFFYNYKDFNVAGNYKANGGTLRNEGNFVVTGLLEINSGATPIENYCRMQALGGIDISNATFFNYSYVWAKNSEIKITGGGITNINIPGASPPMLHGASFNQTGGAVTGPALMYFYGATSITSGGTIGITGTTTDTIKMYDITKTSSSTIFDVQAANTVRPNVIYNAWGAPDSNRVYLFGCSVEIFLEIPLAINWNSFVVDLFDNVPVLNWSAEFDRPTIFEIQRSFDGRSFSAIGQVSSIEGRTGYSYNDKSVNGQPGVVYYRIKGVELGGEVKYSQTRLIKFSQKPGSIYTAPNPFTNNFIINYRSAAKETITIRMFDVSGQQMLAKNVTVIAGDNAINIYEASQIAKGIYVIQISKGSYMISSGKIIKQ